MFLIPEMIAQKVTFDCAISGVSMSKLLTQAGKFQEKRMFFIVVKKIIPSHESARVCVCVCTYTFLGEDIYEHESVRASFIIFGVSPFRYPYYATSTYMSV